MKTIVLIVFYLSIGAGTLHTRQTTLTLRFVQFYHSLFICLFLDFCVSLLLRLRMRLEVTLFKGQGLLNFRWQLRSFFIFFPEEQ